MVLITPSATHGNISSITPKRLEMTVERVPAYPPFQSMFNPPNASPATSSYTSLNAEAVGICEFGWCNSEDGQSKGGMHGTVMLVLVDAEPSSREEGVEASELAVISDDGVSQFMASGNGCTASTNDPRGPSLTLDPHCIVWRITQGILPRCCSKTHPIEEDVWLADRLLGALSKLSAIEEYIIEWQRGLEAERHFCVPVCRVEKQWAILPMNSRR